MVEELESREVWRVSCGATDRQYLGAFTEHDVALVGWGSYGDWNDPSNEGSYVELKSDHRNGYISIQKMAEEVEPGDIVLGTRGKWEVCAIGVVENDLGTGRPYRWNENWGETEGWDLYHQIRVRWAEPLEPIHKPAGQLARGYTVSRVHNESDRSWAREQIAKFPGLFSRRLRDLPSEHEELAWEAIPSAFREARDVIEELLGAHGNNISENTIVALQIVPLLRELGFGVTQIQLEWDSIDVAVFDENNADRPILILEAKAPGRGLTDARDQGMRYGRRYGKPPLLVTNGRTLELYDQGNYEASPARAYLPIPRTSACALFDKLQALAH